MTTEVFLSGLLEKRLKWVEASRENDFEEGIQRLLTDLYPDSAHFIFELLQNAEDAQSTHVLFDLKKDVLTVTHNGKRLFNNKDVESITSIAVSTKKDDITQIGKFGIGFKAVFAYTKSPCIYSGEFAFKIRDLVCPQPIENILSDKANTIFEFPFDHPKKRPSIAFEETADGLMNLGENVLLFLNNIETIEWNIEGKGKGFITRLCHSDSHIEIDHKDILATRSNSHYLRFTNQIDPSSKIKNVAVAFKLDFLQGPGGRKQNLFDDNLPVAKQMQVVQIDGQLSVFFPAEKEATKLQFHIHGPFASTIARDSIPYNNDNRDILRHISALLAESLDKIKNMGLLTVDFLAVLPTDIDGLSDFYKPLQTALVKKMKEAPLVPTHVKGHAPATQLYLGPKAIRDVISDEDLQFLLNKKANVQWAAGAMQNLRPERFMRLLGIDEWGWKELATSVKNKFYWNDGKNNQWLTAKSDDWMQRFYVLLKETIAKTNANLGNGNIVRLESGEHVAGNEAFFPAEDEKKSKKNTDLFPRVRSELLKGPRKGKVREFLALIMVREVGKEDEVKHILETFYPDEYLKDKLEVTQKQHIVHMKRFVSFWSSRREEASELFADYNIFLDDSGEIFRQASSLYIDKPYSRTMLADYFQKIQAQNGNVIKKYRLWPGYSKVQISKFINFAVAMDVIQELAIKKTTVPNNHPDKKELHKDYFAKWTYYKIDQDYTIEGVEAVLKAPDISTSYLIWQCIIKAEPETQFSEFCPNASYTTREAPSSLVYLLKKYLWIPDKSGNFHKPSEMTKEMLHKGFRPDDRNGWLTAIGFGEEEKQKTAEYKELKEFCQNKGLCENAASLLDLIASLPKDEQREKIKGLMKQLQEPKGKTAFPEKESPDPARRAKKVAESMDDAPAKSYEIRERSVRISNGEVKIVAKEYLQDCYINPDGEMVCQICEDVMPFKLDDGSYYFESVELLRDFPKECSEKYLALCPVCSAKYQYANGSKEEDLREAFLNSESLIIPVVLAHENATIRFVKVHLEDLRTVLSGIE